MIESNDKNTFSVPASQEAAYSRSAETEQAYAAALEHAHSVYATESDTIDQRRVEGLGASMVAAAETAPQNPQEVYFDPTDSEMLLNCGRGTIYFRTAAIRGTQSDYDRAA